jgi:hypothetical protein
MRFRADAGYNAHLTGVDVMRTAREVGDRTGTPPGQPGNTMR